MTGPYAYAGTLTGTKTRSCTTQSPQARSDRLKNGNMETNTEANKETKTETDQNVRKGKNYLFMPETRFTGGKSSTVQVFKNVISCAEKGCLEDPTGIDNMYFNMGVGPQTGLPTWRKKSESTKNESLHRTLNSLTNGITNIHVDNFAQRLKIRIHRYNAEVDRKFENRNCTGRTFMKRASARAFEWIKVRMNGQAKGMLKSPPFPSAVQYPIIAKDDSRYEPMGADYHRLGLEQPQQQQQQHPHPQQQEQNPCPQHQQPQQQQPSPHPQQHPPQQQQHTPSLPSPPVDSSPATPRKTNRHLHTLKTRKGGVASKEINWNTANLHEKQLATNTMAANLADGKINFDNTAIAFNTAVLANVNTAIVSNIPPLYTGITTKHALQVFQASMRKDWDTLQALEASSPAATPIVPAFSAGWPMMPAMFPTAPTGPPQKTPASSQAPVQEKNKRQKRRSERYSTVSINDVENMNFEDCRDALNELGKLKKSQQIIYGPSLAYSGTLAVKKARLAAFFAANVEYQLDMHDYL